MHPGRQILKLDITFDWDYRSEMPIRKSLSHVYISLRLGDVIFATS